MSVTTVSREAAAPTKKTKHNPVWRCQFCAQGHHRSCPRATQYAGKLWICQCGDDSGQHAGLYCLTCKHDSAEDVNPTTWQCFDILGCAARRQQRNDNNPLWRMIQAARTAGALERKAKRLNQEALLAGIDPMQEETIERVQTLLNTIDSLTRGAQPKKPRKAGPPKATSGVCECCGGATKGGRFLPGHDAKMVSVLRARVKTGGDSLDAQEAYEELKRRGWLKKLPHALIRREDLIKLGLAK